MQMEKRLRSFCSESYGRLGSWVFYTFCEEKCLHVSASLLPQKLISYLGCLVTGSEMGQKAHELQLLWDTAEASSR